MGKIPELKKVGAKLVSSIRTVTNYRVESNVLKLICVSLKKKYEELPWELATVVIDIPKPDERYIPQRLVDLFERYGLDWPSDEEAGDREEMFHRHGSGNVNEEKIAILNEAVNLGCAWAIEEMERLRGVLFV